MFDSDVKPEVTEAVREADWKALHSMLRELARQRVALEAREAEYLVEADETHLCRRLGYSTMTEYMERELHTARMRRTNGSAWHASSRRCR